MLPMIQRKTRAQYLDEASALLARLAMGAVDGNRRGSQFPPTALRSASYFGNAVGPFVPDPVKGDAYSMTTGQGYSIEELFEAASGHIEDGIRVETHELLGAYYLRIVDALSALKREATAEEISETVAFHLVRDVSDVEGDGVSLWVQFMQACYPDSGHLRAALSGEGKADSQANPFAPWQRVPGTY